MTCFPFDATHFEPKLPTSRARNGMSEDAAQIASERFRHIPSELRSGRWWMVTRGAHGEPNSKKPLRVTKIGERWLAGEGAWTNSDHHCAFSEAIAAIAQDNRLNLMLMLGFGNEFVCVDLDPLEKVAAQHLEAASKYQATLKNKLAHTYSEVSSSGVGTHFIGKAKPLIAGQHKTQHPEYKVDLLFKFGLVLTGDHRQGTTAVADISLEVGKIQSHMESGHGRNRGITTVDTVTPALCDEQRLNAILSGGRHGEAFRTGQGLLGSWSDVVTALTNTASEFCTDETVAYRVLSRSGIVQLAAPAGNGESRLHKFERRWNHEWTKSLARTETARKSKNLAKPQLTLAQKDLWKQSIYVQFMVQKRVLEMITQGLMGEMPPDQMAPLFRYLKPERMNQLQDDLGKVEPAFSKRIMDARKLNANDEDTEVTELNAYLNEVVAEEQRIGVSSRFKEYNQKYYNIENYGGSAMVFETAFDPENGTQRAWRVRAFHEAKASEKVLVGWDTKENGPIIKKAASLWTGHEKARRYVAQKMCFETTKRTVPVETGEILNLYQGWQTKPVSGEWPNIHYLIHDLICAGDLAATDYLLNYVAHMIQLPHILPCTAVILQSEQQGTGKTTFVDLLRSLLGYRYCATTADANTLLGDFNASALNKVLLHFEEAVAPNDRKMESKLKALITNRTMTYNQKGIAMFEERNFARVFMTSNASKVTHLSRFDRRMFVLQVAATHANEPSFWQSAYNAYPYEMEGFMHAMKTRNISDFRPSVIPYTKAKDVQKLESVVGPDAVLFNILQEGRLPPCSQRTGDVWEVRISALKELFKHHDYRIGYRIPRPSDVLKTISLGQATRRLMIDESSKTSRILILPILSDARRKFLGHQGVASHDWGDIADLDWTFD